MIKKFNLLLLTFFNIGNIKYAPGSIASFVTCVLFLIVSEYLSLQIIFFFTLIIFMYSLNAINKSYKDFNYEDPQEIVIDEFVGQIIPLLAIPIYETLYPSSQLFYCTASFLTFRFFDILKPFPINYIEKNTKGALGIMLDDIFAGFITIIILSVIFFFLGG